MPTEATLARAKQTAADLRRRGDEEQARVIETLLDELAAGDASPRDFLTSPQAGELLGVTGQTIKNWVREGRLTAYRLGGRIMIPRAVLEDYLARARTSLDLEELTDEEAAHLVAEGRQRA